MNKLWIVVVIMFLVAGVCYAGQEITTDGNGTIFITDTTTGAGSSAVVFN